MTYQQTIDYLYTHLPMFSRIGAAAYKEDLYNTIALCESLGNPQNKFRSIHVAGTNGKGSTSHMLASILQQAGYKTGLYTSPHLKDFRERIKVDGEMIEESFIVEFVARTRETADELAPSFFELTVAMAFEYFAEKKVDIAVIETGLGGRLDSTNVITPILSIVTNIGYDHMNILGDTLEKIAFEKAGIIKPGVPVVIGEYLPETRAVFEEKARSVAAPIHLASEAYEVSNTQAGNTTLTCNVRSTANGITESFTLDLNGLYQLKNLRTVLCAEAILLQQGFLINDEQEKCALANVKKITGLQGRWDVIAENPLVVLDVAHNADGMQQVLRQVESYQARGKENDGSTGIHFVLGMVKDKEISTLLAMLPKTARYYFTNAHIPRALPALELQQKAASFGLQGNVFDDVNDAVAAAKSWAGKAEMIIVAGSVFLVGEVNTAS